MALKARQEGLLLVTAIFLIVMVAAMIMGLAYLNSAGTGAGGLQGESAKAYYFARSGIEYAKQLSLTGTACGAGLEGTRNVDSGSFTVSGATQYGATSSTLSGAITSNATTIPVGAMGAYAPFGRILIDQEEIVYGAISGNNFINVQRGAGNTVAATHSAGARVYQGVCSVRVTGTMGNASRVLSANMALPLFRTGVITKPAAAGAAATTGVGFRPSVVIFFWTAQAATGVSAEVSSGMGFATASTQYAAVTTMRNGLTPTDNGRRRSTGNAILFQTTAAAPALQAAASLQSMDADGFTLNWTTNLVATGYRISYVALGGDVQGSVGNFDMANVTGNQAISNVGFRPELLLFVQAANAVDNTDTAHAQLGLGFATTAGQGTLVSAGTHNLATSASRWQQLTSAAISYINPATNPPDTVGQGRASLVSMDSNGFTINVNPAPAGANWNVGYLALRGVRAATGSFNQPAAAGIQNSVSTLAFRPIGLMLASWNLAAAGTLNPGRTSIGVAGGNPAAASNVWYAEASAASPSVTNSYNDATNVISMGPNATITNPAQASLQSLLLGGFSLNWTAADATTRQVLYWAIGPRDHADILENY